MALSNWDTLAIDRNGKSCVGKTNFKTGINIEIYKNWVYLFSKKNWSDETGFGKPYIGSINEGEGSILGINYNAKRGLQSGIYIFVTKWQNKVKKYFAGIGCYGYHSRVKEYLENYEGEKNVNEEEWDICSTNTPVSKGGKLMNSNHDFIEVLRKINPKTYESILDENGKKIEYIVNPGFELTVWTGVQKETLEDFKQWIEKECLSIEHDKKDKKWFDSINWNDLHRFNQGDMFFSNNLNIDLNSSKLEESEKPIIEEILKTKK